MNIKCRDGKHYLQDIYTEGKCGGSENVVRWCKECGAIVVDMDFDGRTNAGYHLAMQFPEALKRHAETNTTSPGN